MSKPTVPPVQFTKDELRMNIYIVSRYWFEDWEILQAFEAEADAVQFVNGEKRHDRRHYTIHPTTLSPAATFASRTNESPAAASPPQGEGR